MFNPCQQGLFLRYSSVILCTGETSSSSGTSPVLEYLLTSGPIPGLQRASIDSIGPHELRASRGPSKLVGRHAPLVSAVSIYQQYASTWGSFFDVGEGARGWSGIVILSKLK